MPTASRASSTWAPLVAVALFLAPTVRAQQADESIAPREGEIRLEGTLEAVDANASRLTLNATAFALPNGKRALLPEPRLKTILIDAASLLHPRGAPDAPLNIKALRSGWRAAIVGRDEGTGKPLAARAIALWTREEGGKYLLDAPAPEAAPPVAPPIAAPPIVAPPVIAPPAIAPPVAVGVASENIVENGGFDEEDEFLQPRGWAIPRGGAISVVEDDEANRHLLFKAQGAVEARKIVRAFEVKPGWKSLKVSARVRARGLVVGANPWEDAHVGLAFLNAAGEKFSYAWPVALKADSDWVRRSGVAAIPEGAVRFEVDAANFGTAGEFGVDDLSIVPNAPPEGVELRPNFPEGAFEDLDPQGRSKSWNIDNTPQTGVVEEEGNHFLRLSIPKIGYVGTELLVKLAPGLRRVHVQARLRVRNLQLGKEPWENARLGLAFADAAGGTVGGWPPSLEVRADTGWSLLGQALEVPANAAFLRLTPQFLNAAGTLDVDDIQITTDK